MTGENERRQHTSQIIGMPTQMWVSLAVGGVIAVLILLDGFTGVQKAEAIVSETPTATPTTRPTPTVYEWCKQRDPPATNFIGGDVSGRLDAKRGGNYCAVEGLHVPKGETLTIAPGTVVYFPGEQGLEVEGKLVAEGTLEDPIYFYTYKAWDGVHFLPTSEGSICEYCNISYPEPGEAVILVEAPVTLRFVEIELDRGTAISGTVPFTMSNVVIDDATTAVHLSGTGSYTQYLSHLTIHKCSDGVVNRGNTVFINNSIFSGCSRAVSTEKQGKSTISYSLLPETGEEDEVFSTEEGSVLDKGPGLIYEYWPGFAAYSGDYHLRMDSPAVDTGDPESDYSLEPDPNGGRVNMGAYGNSPVASSKPPPDYVHFNLEMDEVMLSGKPGETLTYTVIISNNLLAPDTYYLHGDAYSERQFHWMGDISYYKGDYSGDISIGPQERYEQKLFVSIPDYATHDRYSLLSLRYDSQYGMTRGIQAVAEVSYPTSVEVVGRIGISPKDVFARGDYLYVTAGEEGLRVLDVSNPSEPEEVGFYDTPDELLGDFGDMEVVGDYAYVLAGLAGMRVVDISNPHNPVEVGAYEPWGYPWELDISGDYAYISWSTSYIQFGYPYEDAMLVVDISNPTNPVEAATYKVRDGSLENVTTAGNYAYIGTNYTEKTLGILDVSNPIEPLEAKSYNLSEYVEREKPNYNIGDIKVAGDYAYISTEDEHLQVFDVSNPEAPTLLTTYKTDGDISSITLQDSRAYIITWLGLYIIDVSDPKNPVELGSYEAPSKILETAVEGDYAYVSTETSGVRVVDISDPATPTEVGYYGVPDDARRVTVDGDYAYVADGTTGLRIIDVSAPASPGETGSYENRGGVYDVEVKGDYAYICGNDLYILDVSDRAAPFEVGAFYWPEQSETKCHNIQILGDYLYVAHEGSILVLDISDPAAPVEVDFPYEPKVIDFELANGSLYVLPPNGFAWAEGGYTSHSRLDILDPVSMQMSGSYYLSDRHPSQDLAVIGDLVYISWSVPDFGHMAIDDWVAMDISNPNAPIGIEPSYRPVSYSVNELRVAAEGRYACVLDGRAGMRVLDISDGTGPVEVDSFGVPGEMYDVAAANGYIYLANGSGGLYILRYTGR